MENADTMKAPCNVCGRSTNHRVLVTRETKVEDPLDLEGDPVWRERYWMLECCGCESISLRCDTRDPLEEEEGETVYYPPRIARRRPEWLQRLPRPVGDLVHEIYAALAAHGPRLAAMGARALIDMVAVERVGDIGPFRAKLEALEVQGLIGQKHREQIQAALDAGSAATHRGFAPSAELVNQVMDIVENLLQSVYILPQAALQLKRATPKRPVKKRQRPAV